MRVPGHDCSTWRTSSFTCHRFTLHPRFLSTRTSSGYLARMASTAILLFLAASASPFLPCARTPTPTCNLHSLPCQQTNKIQRPRSLVHIFTAPSSSPSSTSRNILVSYVTISLVYPSIYRICRRPAFISWLPIFRLLASIMTPSCSCYASCIPSLVPAGYFLSAAAALICTTTTNIHPSRHALRPPPSS